MIERTRKREQLWRSIVGRSKAPAPPGRAATPSVAESRSPPAPDLELLDRWHAGERRAGEELCRRHLEALRGFFATKCRGDADELARRTLIACACGEDPPGERPSFRTYLFTLARRELHRHLQERRPSPLDLSSASISEISKISETAEIMAREDPDDGASPPAPPALTGRGSRAGSSS